MTSSFAMITRDGERQRRSALLECATAVGARRKVVEATLAHLKSTAKGAKTGALSRSEPIFRVDYGSGSAVVTADQGVYVPREEDDPSEPAKGLGWLHPRLRDTVAGATYGTKRVGKVVVPSGLCLVVAGGGAGKTVLCHALAAHDRDRYAVVRAGEPLAGYAVDPTTIAESMGMAMCQSDSIVLDSIKDLLAKGGSAMKSGISRSALVEMTAWSITAHALGVTLFVPLNPSSDDKEVVALMVEAARSNATSTIAFAGGDDKTSQWTYYGRQGEGLPRQKATLRLATVDGLPTVADVSRVHSTVGDIEGGIEITQLLSPSALSGALSRSIVRN